MNQMFLGYTVLEYLFMITYMVLMVMTVYSYVRITDLREQRDYYRYLTGLASKRKE
jgi:hypothetical protein